ncbi:MAG: TetR/AcrR family transcriptional regulator, partial [Rhodococcus fascians]
MAGKNETGFDPARTLGLLWRVGAKKSRTGLTIDSIVDAAVSIADSESLDAVSMRRIADRLGVGTMSLYTHVPGREDLVDLMIDHVQKGLYSALDAP